MQAVSLRSLFSPPRQLFIASSTLRWDLESLGSCPSSRVPQASLLLWEGMFQLVGNSELWKHLNYLVIRQCLIDVPSTTRVKKCVQTRCLLALILITLPPYSFSGEAWRINISKSHFSTKFCSHLSCHINNAHIPGRSLVLSQGSHNKWLQVGCDQEQKFNLSTQETRHPRKARWETAKWIHFPIWTPATSLRSPLLWYELTLTKCTIFTRTHILRFQCTWALAGHYLDLHTCC